eukprot:comp22417_c0_seq1/m.54688 comp22417_c0_seq1/g.54688  ORF comp22417_c0_seq1/g.54688 comp22417_c0_seq1/m.54688 type:complete len:437 (-) comp22417_c0_seq1:175-1485(-)
MPLHARDEGVPDEKVLAGMDVVDVFWSAHGDLGNTFGQLLESEDVGLGEPACAEAQETVDDVEDEARDHKEQDLGLVQSAKEDKDDEEEMDIVEELKELAAHKVEREDRDDQTRDPCDEAKQIRAVLELLDGGVVSDPGDEISRAVQEQDKERGVAEPAVVLDCAIKGNASHAEDCRAAGHGEKEIAHVEQRVGGDALHKQVVRLGGEESGVHAEPEEHEDDIGDREEHVDNGADMQAVWHCDCREEHGALCGLCDYEDDEERHKNDGGHDQVGLGVACGVCDGGAGSCQVDAGISRCAVGMCARERVGGAVGVHNFGLCAAADGNNLVLAGCSRVERAGKVHGGGAAVLDDGRVEHILDGVRGRLVLARGPHVEHGAVGALAGVADVKVAVFVRVVRGIEADTDPARAFRDNHEVNVGFLDKPADGHYGRELECV